MTVAEALFDGTTLTGWHAANPRGRSNSTRVATTQRVTA